MRDVSFNLRTERSTESRCSNQILSNTKDENNTEQKKAEKALKGVFDELSLVNEQLGLEKLSFVDVGKSFDAAVSLLHDLGKMEVVNDCKGLSVLADSLLNQLFYTLLDNSLRYGEKVSRIRIHHKVSKDELKLIYEDDGVGIQEDEKEKIFREGYGKGSGLGLHLLKLACKVYGWNIQETGEHGKGAQFTITIPKEKYQPLN